MRLSFLSVISSYLRGIGAGAISVAGTCLTALPYIFRWGELHKEVTEGYPDPVSSKTADDLPPRSRGLLLNNIDHCTGCRDCQEICPSKCIHIETDLAADVNKLWVSVYNIDYSKCMFCGLCVDACIPGSLVQTRHYEGASQDLKELKSEFGKGHVTSEQRAKWAVLRELNQRKGDKLP